jgi:hypothetical protein
MFAGLQNEVTSRLSGVEQHFSACCPDDRAMHATISKGMVFVQLYAIHEFSTKGMVKAGISAIKGAQVTFDQMRHETLALLLDKETCSVVDAGRQTAWNCRIELFNRARSTSLIDTADGTFPTDGSHFRLPQTYLIWELFGITAPVLPDVQLTHLIGEIVEHRNAIAHGRATATEIGRRFTHTEILKKIRSMLSIWLYQISTMEQHCNVISNVCRTP